MIEVLKPGLYTLVQDSGRYGFLDYGMPISGVMDVDSYRLANWLVGNKNKEAVLELMMTGPELKFTADTYIGITGADMSPMIDGISVSLYETIKVCKGSVLSFGVLKRGFRSYLSFAGGINLPNVMRSRSTYSYAKLGGVDGGAIGKGDRIPLVQKSLLQMKSIAKELRLDQYKSMPVRVLEGPEFGLLSSADKELLFETEFTVSTSSNRMGVRLEGRSLDSPVIDMISSGIVNGTIQLPPNGLPIVLLADSQTTGGYPRVANVIKVDLGIVGQQRPGDKIRFRKISLEEAQALAYNKEQSMMSLG